VFGIDLIWDRVSWRLALRQRRPNAQTNHNRDQHIDSHSYLAIPIVLGLPDLILLPTIELAAFEEAIAFLVVAIHELEIGIRNGVSQYRYRCAQCVPVTLGSFGYLSVNTASICLIIPAKELIFRATTIEHEGRTNASADPQSAQESVQIGGREQNHRRKYRLALLRRTHQHSISSEARF
jgi:hypothetical protein